MRKKDFFNITKRQYSPFWQISMNPPHFDKPIRMTLGAATENMTEREARQFAKQNVYNKVWKLPRLDAIEQIKTLIDSPTIKPETVSDTIQKFIQRYTDVQKQYETLAHFDRILGYKRTNKLKEQDIINYLTQRRQEGAAETSLSMQLNRFKTCLRKSSKISKDQIYDIFDIPKEQRPKPVERPDNWDDEKFFIFKKHVNPYPVRVICEISYRWPVRLEEMLSILTNSCDLSEGALYIKQHVAFEAKTPCSYRKIGLTPYTKKLVEPIYKEAVESHSRFLFNINSEKITKNKFYYYFNSAKKKMYQEMGFENEKGQPINGYIKEDYEVVHHMFRHHAATEMNRNGLNIKQIMAAGGWAKPDMVLKYIKFDIRRDFNEMIEKIARYSDPMN